MGHPHEAGPDLYRQSAAGRLPGRRIVVIAEPDAGHEIGGVADEPRVAEILAGAGLAGGHPARDLSLARGATEQSLLHHGVHHRVTPHVVTKIRTPEGKVLYARLPDQLGQVIEPRGVGMMNTMMQETLLSGTARKAEIPGWMAAGKTGTSQDFRDAWFIGYTANLVTGVWLGNDDNSPTRKATGGGLPVEVWTRFMRSAHHGVAVAALPRSQGPGPFGILAQVASQITAPSAPSARAP